MIEALRNEVLKLLKSEHFISFKWPFW
jgi:hypothetical protein